MTMRMPTATRSRKILYSARRGRAAGTTGTSELEMRTPVSDLIFGCTERVPADETLAGIDVTPGTELLLRTFRKADQ